MSISQKGQCKFKYYNFFHNVTDMSAQLKHSKCHLVEIDSTNSLLYNYRYNTTEGTFTVPPGGDGYYYFTTYLLVGSADNAAFDIKLNGNLLCTAYNELEETPGDPGPATCSAVTYATEGF